ncbi:MAG TPA: cold shock domain-containing protein [Chitinophagaceae bacterium]|nr:cold shock domain-containing protein [Chitinophagaceae bacterium]
MAKSQETFGKKEKEKKRLKQRQDKQEKMDERKANAKSGKSLEDMMAYIDENGNISSTPPDPRKKKVFNQEDMQISVPKYEASEEDLIRTGAVAFFNEDKGFGFINDAKSGERIFIHVNQLTERIVEGDKVTFEVESGARGLSAVNVKKLV